LAGQSPKQPKKGTFESGGATGLAVPRLGHQGQRFKTERKTEKNRQKKKQKKVQFQPKKQENKGFITSDTFDRP